MDLQFFDILKEAGPASVNVSQLARQTGAEVSLIGMGFMLNKNPVYDYDER